VLSFSAHTFSSSSQLEAKPSKSAIKKAQKLARAEKRQRQKALGKSQAGLSPSPENSVASSEVTPSREAVPLPEPSEPSSLNDSEYILPSVPPPVEESSREREKASIEINGMAPGVTVSSTPTPLEAPSTLEPSPTAPLTPQLMEKPSTKPMTLPLHDETSARDAEKVKKRQSFLTRTLWTCIMISGFIGVQFSLPTIVCQLIILRTAAPRPCVYDSAGYALSDSRL
jgi:phosphatidate cytidylyltransferase